MKLFGDPALERKARKAADKLAAAAVLAVSGAAAFCAGIWIAGVIFHAIFSWMGVA